MVSKVTLEILIKCFAIVRIENGKQMIHVEGREPFLGIYTRLIFSKLRCINSLIIDSITPLTGAEEIEFIYKTCKNDTVWHLTHYCNTAGNYSLDLPIFATIFAVITHKPINIIDVDLKPCNINNSIDRLTLRNMRQKCLALDQGIAHKHRRHHRERMLVLEKRKRLKRSLDSDEKIHEFTPKNSPYQILETITVHEKEILRIHAGTHLAFAKNTGIIVNGILQILGTQSEPVLLYALNDTWHGLLLTFANSSNAKQSQIINVNVSGSDLGIRIESSLVPYMEHVISDRNINGITILAYNNDQIHNADVFNCTLKRIVTVNNRENGLSIHVGPRGLGHLVLEEVLSASNRANGFVLEGAVHATILSSQFFSNDENGISIFLINGSTFELHKSSLDSNKMHALQIINAQQILVKLFSNNFTDHNFSEAILVQRANRSDFLLDGCNWWKNAGGGISLQNVTNSDLFLLNGNWTQNRETIVLANRISGKTNILIENNNFQQNQFRNNTVHNSIIELGMMENDHDIRIRLQGNRFLRNAAEVILQISRFELKNTPTDAKIAIVENSFTENMALDTVYLAANHASISYNNFEDSEARCELRSVSTMAINATNNYWGTNNQNEIMHRVCGSHMDKSLISVIVVPFLNSASKQISTVENRQTKGAFSKMFERSLVIGIGETAVFQEGSVLTFKSGQGIIVFGALHLLGQETNPILLRSSGAAPWLGIIINSGAILNANHCILEYATTGLNIDSPRISVANLQITRPQLAGILLTSAFTGTLDLGQSIISHSNGDGIKILQREMHSSIGIRNAVIKDCMETGIDFKSPAGNLTIQNIILENSGSFAIRIIQKEDELLESIIFSNLTVQKQAQMSGGILLNLQNYHLLHIKTSNFLANMLPSLSIISKCKSNATELITASRKILIEKNRFLDNDNPVMRLILDGCVDAKINRNIFTKNNEVGRIGLVTIEISPQSPNDVIIDVAENIFLENTGQWSLYVMATNMYPFNGTIRNNQFTGNRHTRGSLIIGSPQFHVNDNEFDNKLGQFDLEIEYADKEALDATGNYWGNSDIQSVKTRILDGKLDQMRGIAKIDPISRKRAVEDCLALSNCSHNGRCVGLNECVCEPGYAEPDCSQITCLALKNCSMNGYCIAPNLCKCFDGWYGEDCSEATCYAVNNCTGHGTCVSLNECQCDPMYEGPDCSIQAKNCSLTGCNNHGSCIDGKCTCETGWTGSICDKALCDQLNNCSGSGTCIRPQMCECFHGFAGDDCSICEGPSCDLCDAKCVHGRCNPSTRTCICRGGWTGPNCDICAIGKCDVLSVVLYVLPTAAGIHQKDDDILVYGNDLPFVPSKRYTCLYGSTTAEGFYVSSSLVRCKIPNVALPGRYLFNIVPYGADKAVPFLDRRLIHFTLYNECSPNDCKGYCVGAICICPAGRDGLFCEQTKILPKIDHEILDNEKLTQTLEGQPYSVKIPTQVCSDSKKQEGTMLNVNTDADGMSMYPNDMVYWAQPIGRDRPYTVNVTASSLIGECMISWNLTVKPTYTPMITKIETLDDTNMKLIKGVVNYNARSIGEVPVRILVYQNDEVIDNNTVTSKAEGNFEFEYYPLDEATSITAMALHPGISTESNIASLSNNITWHDRIFEIDYDPVINVKPGDQIDVEYQLKNNGNDALMNCQMELIVPRDKIQILKYEKILKALATGDRAPMKVTFTTDKTLDDTSVVLYFHCIDTPRKLIRQQIHAERERSKFSSFPAELLISISPQTLPKIITIDIVNEEGYRFDAVPRIAIQPENTPLFLVSTKPSLQNFTAFSAPQSKLTLFFSYRPILGTTNLTFAGGVSVFDNETPLITVPYRGIHTTSDYFDFHITVRDELSALDPKHVVNDARVVLRNSMLGYDEQRQTRAHEAALFFSVVEGTYQLIVSSPTHQTVSIIVQPSFENSSLAIFTPLSSPYIPVIEDERLSLEESNAQQNALLPELYFTPSTLLVPQHGTDEIQLLVRSRPNGPKDAIALMPSIEIYDPQNLPFNFAMADLHNGLRAGDGYRIKSKLSTVLMQANNAAACNIFALQIPFIYAVPNSMSNFVRHSTLLIDGRKENDNKIIFCKAGLQIAPEETSLWTKTTIHCNCALKAKEQCRKKYVSAATCGTTAWKYIPDDTVSLQTLAMFIVLMADCRAAGVDFRKLKHSLTCATSLDSRCPISRLRRSNQIIRVKQSEQRVQFFNQLALISEQADGVLQKYFPALNMLQSQTVNTAALFSTFFEQLNVVLPFKYFEEINDRQWFDKFFESISDSSEDGVAISASEFQKLQGEKGGEDLAGRWNATVEEWSRTTDTFPESNISSIKFLDARELIIRSDRLKTLTRQYGAENPFTLLHDYMGKLLSRSPENISGLQQAQNSGNDNDDICAYAYTLITPARPYENSDFQIILKVINKKNESLESVKVTLEMIRSRIDTSTMQFRIGPLMVDGISSIEGSSKLPPNASLTARWNLKPIKNARLTFEADYQAVLVLEFIRNGRKNVQQIATQTVTFQPRPSLKIYYFISNLIPSDGKEQTNASSTIFSAMIAFMNTGYSHLKNIEIEEIRISVLSNDATKSSVPYQIDSIISDGDSDDIGLDAKIATIESGKSYNIMYNISSYSEPGGRIHDFKIVASIDGKVIALEDNRTFKIQQFISPTKFLVSLQSNSGSLFYYDMQKTSMRTVTPLVFINVNEKTGTSDGKPFRRQIASFHLAEPKQQPSSFYGRVPYPNDLEKDFEVLRVNQIDKDGTLNLVDPRNVWNSNNGKEFVHFIDENPPAESENIIYEVIYGNAEQFLRPRFEFPIYNIPLLSENWPQIGDEVARISATSPSQSIIEYELYAADHFEKANEYFGINPETGAIMLKNEIPEDSEISYCMTVRAKDDRGRIETAAVNIGSPKECHKIENFDGLKSIIYKPSKSRPSKPDDASYSWGESFTSTSELPKLYTFTSTKTAMKLSSLLTRSHETETSVGFWTTSSPERGQHEYTKLIASQSGYDFNLTTDASSSYPNSTLGYDFTSVSTADIESHHGTMFGTSSSRNSSSYFTTETGEAEESEESKFSTNGTSPGAITDQFKLSSTKQTDNDFSVINGHGGTWDEKGNTGGHEEEIDEGFGGSWNQSTATSNFGTNAEDQLYRTSEVTGSSVSNYSSKTIDDNNRSTSEATSESDTDRVSKTGTSSPDSENLAGSVRMPSVADTRKESSSVHQPIEHTSATSFTYNVSTTNDSYFNLPPVWSSSENTGRPVNVTQTADFTGDKWLTDADSGDYSLKTTSQEGTFSSTVTSSEQPITESRKEEISNIRPVPENPVEPLPGQRFVDDGSKETFPEMACRLKDTKPIWSLICDLSKTARIKRIAT